MTWDDPVADGQRLGVGKRDFCNESIQAIKRRGATKVASRDEYTDYYCDGVADDVQLANAFTDLADGGTLQLNRGTYIITKVLNPANGKFQLVGQGRENTVLKLGENCHILGLAVNDVTIRDLSFDGNKSSYSSDYWCGIVGGPADSVLVENCDFYNFHGKGVYAGGWTNSQFVNCRFYSNDQDGLFLEQTAGPIQAQRILVANCISHSNTRKGFNVGNVKDIKYVDCIAYSNEDGWNLEGSSDGTYQLENVKLISCTAYSNSAYGFRVQMQDYNVSLIDCDAYSNQIGFYIRGHDTHFMKNIKILGGNAYLNTTNGVSISYGIKHLKIDDFSTYNNDQGDTGNDGISFAYPTNFEHFILSNIHAYDDQGAATQDRGVDFGVGDESAKDIVCMNIWGEGNTAALFRGTVTANFNIQGTADKIDMNDGYIHDPKNYATSVAGNQNKVMEVIIGGVSYYIPLYDAKT